MLHATLLQACMCGWVASFVAVVVVCLVGVGRQGRRPFPFTRPTITQPSFTHSHTHSFPSLTKTTNPTQHSPQTPQMLLFPKQYSRKALNVPAPAVSREAPSHSSTRVFASLMGVEGLFSTFISPALSTRELLRLGATCRDLCGPARALVTEVCVLRDITKRAAVPRAVRIGLPFLPGLRVLDLSGVELSAKDYSALASALLASDARPRSHLRAFRLRQAGNFSPSSIPQEGELLLLQFLQGMVAAQAWPLLEDLDLSGHCIGDAAVELLVSWLEGGHAAPRRLKRLGLSAMNMSDQGLMHLLRPLAKGRCPILLRLDLSRNVCGRGGDGTDGDGDGKKAWQQAVWRAALVGMPHLLELDLSDSGVEGEVTLALAQALVKGACRKLKRLSLGGCSLTDQDSQCLFQALGEGACPWLQDLNLRQTCLEREAFTALASVMDAQQMKYLRRLDLSENLLTYEGMQLIITALQHKAAPQLRMLHLASTGEDFEEVTEMARLWITKLREDGHCPLLRDGAEEEEERNRKKQKAVAAAAALAAAGEEGEVSED